MKSYLILAGNLIAINITTSKINTFYILDKEYTQFIKYILKKKILMLISVFLLLFNSIETLIRLYIILIVETNVVFLFIIQTKKIILIYFVGLKFFFLFIGIILRKTNIKTFNCNRTIIRILDFILNAENGILIKFVSIIKFLQLLIIVFFLTNKGK